MSQRNREETRACGGGKSGRNRARDHDDQHEIPARHKTRTHGKRKSEARTVCTQAYAPGWHVSACARVYDKTRMEACVRRHARASSHARHTRHGARTLTAHTSQRKETHLSLAGVKPSEERGGPLVFEDRLGHLVVHPPHQHCFHLLLYLLCACVYVCVCACVRARRVCACVHTPACCIQT